MATTGTSGRNKPRKPYNRAGSLQCHQWRSEARHLAKIGLKLRWSRLFGQGTLACFMDRDSWGVVAYHDDTTGIVRMYRTVAPADDALCPEDDFARQLAELARLKADHDLHRRTPG